MKSLILSALSVLAIAAPSLAIEAGVSNGTSIRCVHGSSSTLSVLDYKENGVKAAYTGAVKVDVGPIGNDLGGRYVSVSGSGSFSHSSFSLGQQSTTNATETYSGSDTMQTNSSFAN